MPNRIIKESICKSEDIDNLSWFEEVLFYRLIVTCDDYGRFDGREKIIRSACFPLKDTSLDDVASGLKKLEDMGMVQRYVVGGKQYIQLTSWDAHQRIRSKRSKYPGPNGEVVNMNTDDDELPQVDDELLTCDDKLPQDAAKNCRESESESESESKSKSKSESKKRERDKYSLVEQEQIAEVVAHLNERCGTNYKPTTKDTAEHIHARLAEGYTVDDLKSVIDKKARDWVGSEWEKYLRPKTLFIPANFENYINQPDRNKTGREGIDAFLRGGADDG